MIPKLHKKGSSFKGAVAYLLHDKREDGKAPSSDRVQWVETSNLATDDPDTAWRLMAATALDGDRLKVQAGVKNTGRKSNLHVLHLSLSWHPEENKTKEQMIEAAKGSLAAIGASDRQAMFIAHNDEEHQHIHILANRVSSDDGRLLSSSKDRNKLSGWAEKYEKDNGKIYCEERVLNNQARRRGEKVTVNDKPRHLYDMQVPTKEAANDNQSLKDKLEKLKATQRTRDALLSQQSRAMHKSHADKSESFYTDYKANVRADREKAAKRAQEIKSNVITMYKPAWREQFYDHKQDRVEYVENEKTLIGKARNIVTSIRESRIRRLGIFDVVASSGARKERLEELHRLEEADLRKEQREQHQSYLAKHEKEQRGKVAVHRREFLDSKRGFEKEKANDIEKMRKNWLLRNQERKAAFAELEQWRIAEAKRDMNKAASPTPVPIGSNGKVIKLKTDFNNAAKKPQGTKQGNGEDEQSAVKRVRNRRDRSNDHKKPKRARKPKTQSLSPAPALDDKLKAREATREDRALKANSERVASFRKERDTRRGSQSRGRDDGREL